MLAGVALGVVAAGALAPVRSQAADEASIYLVHGLAEGTVAVTVDGTSVVERLGATEVAGPFSLAAGERRVTFTTADGTEVTSSVELEPGASSDVVVHLPATPGGDPVVTEYPNDLSAVQRGRAAVAVAHTAAVPPADIRVDGEVLFANVANGEYLYEVVPAGGYEVDIVPTGRTSPAVLGPLELELTAGALTRVYAVGDPGTDSMDVASHVISTGTSGSERPRSVDTGRGGLADRLLDRR